MRNRDIAAGAKIERAGNGHESDIAIARDAHIRVQKGLEICVGAIRRAETGDIAGATSEKGLEQIARRRSILRRRIVEVQRKVRSRIVGKDGILVGRPRGVLNIRNIA